MNKIVVFASGSGSNAENIIKHFKNNNLTTVTHVFCNNPNAFVINRAKKLDIPVYVFNSEDFKEKNGVHSKLLSINPDLIVLAGFLWKFPKYLVSVFHNKIINKPEQIHKEYKDHPKKLFYYYFLISLYKIAYLNDLVFLSLY